VAGGGPDDAANFTLLSNQLLGAIGGPPEARPAVLLPRGKIEAYRYADLAPQGGDKMTVFAAQTSGGVVNVACVGGVSAADCDSVAGSLKVQGDPLPIGPDEKFAEQVNNVLGDYTKASGSAQKALSSAKDNKAQAKAAADMAKANSSAKKGVDAIEPNPADAGLQKVLGDAFASGAKAWGDLASAASKNSKDAYKKAESAISKAEKELQGALSAFEAAGYSSDA
jgi:hypothetical protein